MTRRMMRGWHPAVPAPVSPPPPPYSGLPSGVTLRPVDGGSTYYADNGYTYAAHPDATMTAAGALSWDDPEFFPVGQFFAFYPDNSISVFKQLGLNFTESATADTVMSTLHDGGIYAILQGDNGSGNVAPAVFGPETAGWHVEEPGSWNQPGDATSITAQVASCPDLAGRFIHTALTSTQVNYPLFGSAPYPDTPGNGTIQAVFGTAVPGTAAKLAMPCMDQYMFADRNIESAQDNINGIEAGTYSPCTPGQAARGSNYGDIVDYLREWVNGTQGTDPAPVIGPYIECDDALLAAEGAVPVRPGEMNWAVWSAITHGARGVIYFAAASDSGNQSAFGFSQTPQAGETVSNFTQAVSTNGLIRNLARVLNSQFALGFAAVTPAAYVFPDALVSMTGPRNGWGAAGIDIMAKAFTGPAYTAGGITCEPGFYIVATYRGPGTSTGIAATFTTAGGYNGPVTVINADGGTAAYGTTSTITAADGTWSDTFAAATSVRIYHVPWPF